MDKKRIDVACLPVAGIENPYQYLMIKGLNASKKINAFNGVNDRFFGILKTWFRHRPDYIHFDWINSYYIRRSSWMTYILLPVFIIQVLYLRLFTKTKIVWTLHNLMPHNSTNLFVNKYLRRFFSKQCNWIRVFSESTVYDVSNLLRVSKHKIIVIPEGDYCSYYPNTVSRSEARRIFNFNQQDKVFLYLGFIKPYKGIERLISNFTKLKGENLKLIIAGQNKNKGYVNSLKEKISLSDSNRIIFKDNFIPDSELQNYYNACDIVVLPFDKIDNSGSVILAMGFKKPIIAPYMGALIKRLQCQENLLYKENLYDKLNEIIALSNKELIEIGIKNFNFLHNFDWKHFSTHFLKNN